MRIKINVANLEKHLTQCLAHSNYLLTDSYFLLLTKNSRGGWVASLDKNEGCGEYSLLAKQR